ncbi:MAG: glycosyl transferase family 1, partial [Pseudomonadota bacterium]
MSTFYRNLQSEFSSFLKNYQANLTPNGSVKIDLHCHDYNSDVPDELWGRILHVPETYLPTKQLLSCLDEHGTDVRTITNHNNARSCWDLLDQGIDVLSGAEFTCSFPEMGVQVHVLTYGFTPEQEGKLIQLRRDIYQFLSYTAENDLPTILAHPLFFHIENGGGVPPAFLEKIAILFERYEVLNGQRDVWQNLLTGKWIENLSEEKIGLWSIKHKLNPKHFTNRVWPKKMVGGSDDHMGLFAGLCGTSVQIDQSKKGQYPLSKLVLEALKNGKMAPYGNVATHERLNIAFLDYLCQVGLNIEDPGLLRMFLHQGSLKDKLICLTISNAVQELRRHNYTSNFFKIFHEALAGNGPGMLTKWSIAKDYRPIVEQLASVAQVRKDNPNGLTQKLNEFIPFTFNHLNKVLAERIKLKIGPLMKGESKKISFNDLIRKFEVPSHLRSLMGGNGVKHDTKNDMAHVNMLEIFDQLSFPALFSGIIAASDLISTRVLFHQRKFLNKLSGELNCYQHPKKALWITDTLMDRNGVSHALQSNLKEVQKRNLPIDFLVCSNT